MATIFDRVKDELNVVLTAHLVTSTPQLAKEIRTSRGYDTAQTPYIILSTSSYGERQSDQTEQVYITISTLAKFADATEEEAAEKALDDIEQVLIDTLGLDGLYQPHSPYWGAIDRYRRSWRPFSPIGPGLRYAEQYFRFDL